MRPATVSATVNKGSPRVRRSLSVIAFREDTNNYHSLPNFCQQALAQVCAFHSPFFVKMSEIAIFRQ